MKNGKLLSVFLATLLIASFAAFMPKTYAITGTGMYIDPSQKNYPVPGPTIGETFDIEVRAANFSELFTIGCSLKWNVTILNFTGYIMGDMGWGAGIPMAPVINYGAGTAEGFGWTSTTVSSTVSGSNYKVFFTASWIVVGFGSDAKAIDLYDCDLIDTYGTHLVTPYPFDSPHDCEVIVEKPPPFSPTASFTYAPPLPTEGDTVTFDASSSTSGFDGTNICAITSYMWDWENDGVVDDTTPSSTIPHVFAIAGLYTVNLTVYAPPGIGADPGYDPYDWTTKAVTVIPPSFGRDIDVYTQSYRHPDYDTIYTGEGPDMPADAFAPQDEVCLTAVVLYNGWPIQNKKVVFAVYGPENGYQNITVPRTVLTDENGTATMCFRIPWPCENSEEIVFGTWNVIAKVDIAEETVNDTLTFEVGWIIELKTGSIVFEDTMGVPTSTFAHGEHIRFDFEVENMAMEDRLVYFTIVVYDELGVPFCEITFFKTIHAGMGYVYVIDCLIPKWAYAGVATAYINAYTNDPWLCGVPWCPEISGNFIIEAA